MAFGDDHPARGSNPQPVADLTSAVVLKMAPNPLHSGAIGIARSLGRLGVAVYLAGDDDAGPAVRSRYVRGVRPLPDGLASPKDTVEWLLEVAPTSPALLIPVDDPGAALTAEYAEALSGCYRFPRVAPAVIEALGDKDSLATSAAAAGVPAPAHRAPQTESELHRVAADLGWPLVVKARNSTLLTQCPDATSVAIARDDDRLTRLWRTHLIDGRPNCIVQEYIPGGPDTVWMVNAYYDATSTPLFAASGRKVRQHPAYTGATSLGRCEHNQTVIDLTERLVRQVGYRGILDIGWRFDARDGQYKVLDANPRIGATFRLFAADDGTDVVRVMWADLSGKPVAPAATRDGRTWLHEPSDLRTARHYLRDRATSLPGYLRSIAHVDEHAWYAADDRAPMGPVLRDFGADVTRRLGIRRPGRRRRQRPVVRQPARPKGR